MQKDRGQSMKILIVEDNIHIIEMYYDQCKEAGLKIRLEETSSHAIRSIAKEKPDLLVCDGKIPESFGRLAIKQQGLRVLEVAKDAGVKDRWITSSLPEIMDEALEKGFATEAWDKSQVIGKIAEWLEANKDG